MKVFSAFYFGPIDYFANLAQNETFRIEQFENFQKQTYRNRCYVLGANGPLMLGIPILHNGKRVLKDIQPSYDYDWQKEHLKSLIAAYKSSPYFEFYEDDVTPLFERKEKYLLDINLKTIAFINEKLKLELNFELTNGYEFLAENDDYRTRFNAKKNTTQIPPYYQVFGDKFEFEHNLSIFDLLFNEGPASSNFLKQLEV